MTREFFLVKELAPLLRVTPGTIYKMIKTGKIATTRVGKKILIPRAEIERILPDGWFDEKFRESFNEYEWLLETGHKKLHKKFIDKNHHIPWREMEYEDFVAYFHLLVVKKWHEEKREHDPYFPSPTWMRRNGFATFCEMITKYLKDEEPVNTPLKFIKLEREKLKINV